MGSTKTDDYESQLCAAFSTTPLMFNTPKPPAENPPQPPQTPKTPQTPIKEPPLCVQNAMNREKKPFTYTPGGIDLSQIRSEKMARRLMRNAMSPGVQERPAPTFTPTTPDTPTTPKAAPQFYNMPVAVFPQIKIPPNPMRLLRRTSGPFSRSESVDRVAEVVNIPPSQETLNGLAEETAKIASEIDKALEEMIGESKAKTENDSKKLEVTVEEPVLNKIEIKTDIVENGLISPMKINENPINETIKLCEKEIIKSDEPKVNIEIKINRDADSDFKKSFVVENNSPILVNGIHKMLEETEVQNTVEEKVEKPKENEIKINGDDLVTEATVKITCDNVFDDENMSSSIEKCASLNDNELIQEPRIQEEKAVEVQIVEEIEIKVNENDRENEAREYSREPSVEVTLTLPKPFSPKLREAANFKENSVDRLELPRSRSPRPYESPIQENSSSSNLTSRSSVSPIRTIVTPNVREPSSEKYTLSLPRAFSPCRIISLTNDTEPEIINIKESEKPIVELSVRTQKSPLDIIRALSPQPFVKEKSIERAYSPVKFSSPLPEQASPVIMRDKRIASPNRKLDGLKTLSSDLDSMPTLNICTKRFSFLRDSPDKAKEDCFDAYTKPPQKISLIDKPNIDEKPHEPVQSNHIVQRNSVCSNDDLLKEAIEINKKSSASNTEQVLPPWEYEESAEPLGIVTKEFNVPPQTTTPKLAIPLSTPSTKWKHSYQPQIKPLGFLPGTEAQPANKIESYSKTPVNNVAKEAPKPVNAEEIDNKEPPWRRELREMAIKRQEINDEIEAKAHIEHPWRKELRELHQTKEATNEPRPAEIPATINSNNVPFSIPSNNNTNGLNSSYQITNNQFSADYRTSSNPTPQQFANNPVDSVPYSYPSLSINPPQYPPSVTAVPNNTYQTWDPTRTLQTNQAMHEPMYASSFNAPKNKGWSQTLRPKSWVERKADLCRERETVIPEWTKSATLKRNAFSKNTSDYSSGGSSPGKEIRNTPEITIENVGQAPTTKTNNNGYSYPWASPSSPDSSFAFSPEPPSDRTPTPQSRSSPYRQYVPNLTYYGNTPVVRREYGTLSFEPNKRHLVRSCPIQSRSFKYLQLLTGTDDTYEDDEPFIPQPAQHALPRPENL